MPRLSTVDAAAFYNLSKLIKISFVDCPNLKMTTGKFLLENPSILKLSFEHTGLTEMPDIEGPMIESKVVVHAEM